MALISKQKQATMSKERTRTFVSFKEKIIAALKKAGFSPREIQKLEKILDSADKKNIIFIQALLTSLKAAGITARDLEKLRSILNMAYKNIISGTKPVLSKDDSEELILLLSKNKLPYKAAHRLDTDIQLGDETLIQEFNESIDATSFSFTISSPIDDDELRSLSKTIPRKKSA